MDVFLNTPDGRLERHTIQSMPDVAVDVSSLVGQQIRQTEYEASLETLDQQTRGLRLEQGRDMRRRMRDAYRALVDAGIPDAAAQQMSGWASGMQHPDDEEPNDGQ